MSRNHIIMRKIREILRLRFICRCSHEEIAKSVGIGSTTVGECLARLKKANLSWPLPDDLTDEQLEIKLYTSHKINKNQNEEIDWGHIHKELKRKSVTLMLLWNEYREKSPEGLGYSQFCCNYRVWKNHLDVWMHQIHKAGEMILLHFGRHNEESHRE